MTFPASRSVLEAALASSAFPAAAVEVGRTGGPLWQDAFGTLTGESHAPPCTLETVFDLASLTKVIATTSLAMRLVANSRLDLDAPVADWLPLWRSQPHAAIRVRHLLDHSSGLPAHGRYWELGAGRADYERILLGLPLERPPGTAAVYSDPGFILLGFLLEQATGAPLDGQFREMTSALAGDLCFLPPAAWRTRIAPTGFDPWRHRTLVGEVHDENAAALGGVAGHAGLFGTVSAVGAFARLVLRTFDERTVLGTPDSMRRFATRSSVAASSRALGWDTMLPTSSCGTRLSPTSIGHTGFTGTSLWIDHERGIYVVLLTNRVHQTRTSNALAEVRPRLHDAIVGDLG